MKIAPSTLRRAAVIALASLTPVLSPVAQAGTEDWTNSFVEARAEASSEQKDLLLLFTGSDWCPPCMALEEQVLDQSSFNEPMAGGFVPVLLDFPRSKPQEDATRRQNSSLQSRYQIQGYPTMLLTDAAGQVYAKAGYDDVLAARGPEAYAAHLMQMRSIREHRDAAFAQAEAASGVERARALDRGLDAVGPELAAAFYVNVMRDVVALDPNDEAGLRTKYQQLLNRQLLEEELNHAVQRLQSGELREGLDDIAAMIERYQPEGDMLQTLELVRAQAFALLNESDAARSAFERSIAAAPGSPAVRDIRQMMDQILK